MMRSNRLAAAAAALVCLLAAGAKLGQFSHGKPAGATASMSTAAPVVEVWRRTLVVGDADRDWLYCWSADGLTPELSLVSGSSTIKLAAVRFRPAAWFEAGWHVGGRLPINTAPGDYSLRVGAVDCGRVTVLPRVARPVVRVTCDVPDAADAIESAAAGGDVSLGPGEFRLSRPLRLPAGRVVRGAGSVLSGERITQADPLIHWRGVSFRGGWLGSFDPGSSFIDCVFDRCQVWAQGGLFVDCAWRGLAGARDGQTHAFSTWGLSGPLGMVGAVFDSTDRGPVLNSFTSPITGALFADVVVRGLGWVENGNEVLCIEGGEDSPGVRRCVFHRWRVYDCEGDATAFFAPVVDCVFDGWAADRASLLLLSRKPGTCTGNRVTRCEFRGGGLVLGAGVSSTVVERCAFLSPGVFRGNRGFTQPFFYDEKLNAAEAAKYNPPARVSANGVDSRGNIIAESFFGGGK